MQILEYIDLLVVYFGLWAEAKRYRVLLTALKQIQIKLWVDCLQMPRVVGHLVRVHVHEVVEVAAGYAGLPTFVPAEV